MQDAANQLGIGLSVLKRLSRRLGLSRWPYRTRRSLRGVIEKTEMYLHEVRAGHATTALDCHTHAHPESTADLT